MKTKITNRKCKDCYIIISYIPRRIRCLDCHHKNFNNAIISQKKNTTHTPKQVNEEVNEQVRKLPIVNIVDNTKEEVLK